MRVLRDSASGVEIALSRDELLLLNNALNEVCNGIHIEEPEFATRLGLDRSEALSLLSAVNRLLDRVSSN